MAFEPLKIPFSARARSAKFSDSCLCGLHGAAAPSSTKRCARAPLGRSRAPSRSARTPRGAARAAYGSLMRAGKPARAPRYCRALWRKRRPRSRAAVGELDRRRTAPGSTRAHRRRLWAQQAHRRTRAQRTSRRCSPLCARGPDVSTCALDNGVYGAFASCSVQSMYIR